MIEWLKANTEEAATGALVVLLTALAAIGRMFGRRPTPPKTAELAGAVIDNAAVKPLITAYNENSVALRTAARALGHAAAALKANTDATNNSVAMQGLLLAEVRRAAAASERTATAQEEANERLERIKDELIRRSGR